MRNFVITLFLVVTAFTHLSAQNFPEMKKDPLGCLYGFVDSNGQWLIEPQFEGIERFFDEAYDYRYREIESFRKIPFSHYRIVEKNGLKGLLNENLELILPIEFKTIKALLRFDSLGYLHAPTDSLYLRDHFAIEESYPHPPYYSYKDGVYSPTFCSLSKLLVQDTDNNWFNFNTKTKKLSPPFLQAKWLQSQETDGVRLFSDENRSGILRSDTIIELPKYDWLFYILNKRLLAAKNGKLGVLDLDGSEIIPCDFDSIASIWHYSTILAFKGNGLYLYDQAGELKHRWTNVQQFFGEFDFTTPNAFFYRYYFQYKTGYNEGDRFLVVNKKNKAWFVKGNGDVVSLTEKDEIKLPTTYNWQKYYEVSGENGKGVLVLETEDQKPFGMGEMLTKTNYRKIEPATEPNWLLLHSKDSVSLMNDGGRLITTMPRNSISGIHRTWLDLRQLYTITNKNGCRQFISFGRLVYSTCGEEIVFPAPHVKGQAIIVKKLNNYSIALNPENDTVVPFSFDTFYLKSAHSRTFSYVDDVIFISGKRVFSIKEKLDEGKNKDVSTPKPYHAWTNDSLSFIIDSNSRIVGEFIGKGEMHKRVFRGKQVFQISHQKDTQYYVPALDTVITKEVLSSAPFALMRKACYFHKSNNELFSAGFQFIAPVEGLGFVGATENQIQGLLDGDTNLIVKFNLLDRVIGFYGFNAQDSTFFLRYGGGYSQDDNGNGRHKIYWKIHRLSRQNRLEDLSSQSFALPFLLEEKMLFMTDDGNWGLMAKQDFQIIIYPEYDGLALQKDVAYFFYDSRFKNVKDEERQRWCFITDTSGKKLYEGFAAAISVFKEGRALLIEENQIKILTIKGEVFDISNLSVKESEEIVQTFIPTAPSMKLHEAWSDNQKKVYVEYFIREFYKMARYFSPSRAGHILKAEEWIPALEYSPRSSSFKTPKERNSIENKEPKPYEQYYKIIQSSSTFSLVHDNYVKGSYAISDQHIWEIDADELTVADKESESYRAFNALIRGKLEQNETISLNCSQTDDYLGMVGGKFALDDESLILYFFDNNSRKHFPVSLSRQECDPYLKSKYQRI